MNEIQVTVQQTPGTVKWNFKELKESLEKELSIYETTQYDDNSVKDARGDLAYLRSLRKAVEEKRKDIKSKCLEPYEEIERQAKELVELIDKPIGVINEKVQEYETRRKKQVRKEIYAYMQEAFSKIPEDIRERAMESSYDTKWENVSTTKKTWKEAIGGKAEAFMNDLSVIQAVDEEFLEDAIAAYKRRFVLADAMSKVQEMKRQKERILEAERRRKIQEEENRRRQEAQKEAERKAAEEKSTKQDPEGKKSMSQDELNRIAAQTLANLMGPNMELRDRDGNLVEKSEDQTGQKIVSGAETFDGNPLLASQIGKAIEQTEREAFQRAVGSAIKPEQTIRIIGSPEQYQKVLQYIKFIGADYEEV